MWNWPGSGPFSAEINLFGPAAPSKSSPNRALETFLTSGDLKHQF
jgi:hypothetical protein